MKYIYGPVQSRRLGHSLGITLTPYKTCNFNCVYCQLGRSINIAKERREYISIQEILNEIKLWLKENAEKAKELDYITLSGSGEPTLNIKTGELISQIKNITAIPVAVITNASLMNIAEVRHELLNVDLIVPSLDAATDEIFAKIDRPAQDIKIDDIINGLIDLRKEFRGKLWLEVMLVKGFNDNLSHIRKLKEIIEKINPDKIQLNSPVRTTAEENIRAVDKKRLEEIRQVLGEKCEIL